MWWLKSLLWKIGTATVCLLLLLLLLTRSIASAEDVQKGTSGFPKSDVVATQATPTEDATVAALNKEKLVQEVQQLKNQNEAGLPGWFQMNASILISTLIVVIGGLIGFFRWLADRRNEREKRAEERFQSVVTGLGEEKEGAKVGAAILLRTFLHPAYKKFHVQTFDLVVANLRLPRTLNVPEDPDTPLPLTTLSQALIVVFKEAFPRARNQNQGTSQFLDATAIQLDNAYLSGADLINAWMPLASLRKADLTGAKLSEAKLRGAKLRGADLIGADLRSADLSEADLSEADLSGANLSGANLRRADLSRAILKGTILKGTILKGAILRNTTIFRGASLKGPFAIDTNAGTKKADFSDARLGGADLSKANLIQTNLSRTSFRGAILKEAQLTGADLSGASFFKADLREANLNMVTLSGANIEDALFLNETDLRKVNGLTKEQLETCKEKGAIIDEDLATGASGSIISTPLLLQSSKEEVRLTTSAQEIIETLDTSNSTATVSQTDLET